ANATILMLARNSDVDNAVRSARRLEDRFNKKFGYPWLFLNEEPFSEEFKTRVSNVINGEVTFGLVPREHWYQPDWINETLATAGREKMAADNIIYGGSVSYRNMCRFNSGFFYRHPLLQQYKWYWRVEPDVHFHCDIDFDPFLFMED
ncbi:glycosyltransferase family 15 protein, partial [Polyporus arcularius HHB13444]